MPEPFGTDLDENLDEDVDALVTLGEAVDDPDPEAADAARAALGGEHADVLGRLGDLAFWWASVRGDATAAPPSRVLLVGGDPAVAARRDGVTALALPAALSLVPDPADDADAAVDAALDWGRAAADDAADRGVDLLLLSVPDPAARALTADVLGLDAVEASGWPEPGPGGDELWMAEVIALRDRLYRLRGLRDRPVALLRGLQAPAVAGAVALLVQAAARRTPVLLDGPGAAAAALLATRARYRVSAWYQAAHEAEGLLHERALGSLGLEPLSRLGIGVEDGTAALAGLAVLDTAAALLGGSRPADG